VARIGSASHDHSRAYRRTGLCSRNEHRSISDAINHGLIISNDPVRVERSRDTLRGCLDFARHERVGLNRANFNSAAAAWLHPEQARPRRLHAESGAGGVPRGGGVDLRGVGGAFRG
jgi:hypothetical protein